MRPAGPEIIVSVATMGIPLAIEASRALGMDDYVILHKTPKIHLGESWAEPVYSITTDKPQRLRHRSGPRRRCAGPPGGRGRRRHLDRCLAVVGPPPGPTSCEAEPVVVGTLMTEGGAWKRRWGTDATLVRTLGSMPLFHPDGSGGLVEDWD